MQKLTAMQQKIYDYIADAIRTQGYPPSVREIGEVLGLSQSAVTTRLSRARKLLRERWEAWQDDE